MKLFVTLALFVGFWSAASEMDGSFKSIQWQRVDLQDRIERRVKRTVQSLVQEKDFLIEVDINYYAPPKPNFDRDPTPEIKISEKEFKDSSKDYIVFSKLGLEVPTMASNRKAEQKKLNDIWKFRESNNIFKNLESVRIIIYIEKEIKDATVESLKTLLNNLKLPLGDIVAEVEIEKVPFAENRVTKKIAKKVEKSRLQKIAEILSKFSTMFGLIFSTIILILGGFFLLKKFRDYKDDQAAKEMITQAANSLDDEKDGGPGGGATIAQGDGSGIDTHLIGFERFNKFMENSSDEAVHIVKKWIKDGSKESTNALNAIVKQLDNETLLKVFAKIGPEDRAAWKANLDDSLTIEDVNRANDFISNQIVTEIIAPHVLRDFELLDTMLSLTPDEGVNFVNNYPEYKGMFMNIVNPKFFSRIADQLDDQSLLNVIEEGIKFEEFDENDSYDDFKSKLNSCLTVKKQKPFIKRIVDLIPTATPKLEKSLYDALVKEEEFSTISKLSHESFPSFLMKEATEEIIEPIFRSYPIKKKVQLLSLDSPEFNSKLIRLFAPEGSKARDFLDIEIQLAAENHELQRKLKDNPEQIYYEFVNYFRAYLDKNSGSKELCRNFIEEWVKNLRGHEDEETLKYAS